MADSQEKLSYSSRGAETDVKKTIRRRKLMDAAFAVLGTVLITGSLAVLGLLLADLIADGGARLTETTYVKEDGSAPGRLEIIGLLSKRPDAEAGKPGWVVDRNEIDLAFTPETQGEYANLNGQRVVVSGGAPELGEAMEVEKIAALPKDVAGGVKQPRIGRRDTIGVLKKKASVGVNKAEWALVPQGVTLDTAEAQEPIDLESYAGERVAVSGAFQRAEGVVKVAGVSKLVEKSFFTSMPSRKADRAGIFSAWVGTCLVMLVTICTALPLGVAAGVYLEEYAPKNWFTALIEINIANLAGVPSIIWGLMALGLFVYKFGLGTSIRTAGLTLGLLVLPIVIIATREAIRAIPSGIRDASYALGATKWETTRYHVIPYSMGGILTGTIVSLSRAIGETAPLITIGALTYVAFLPDSPVKAEFPYISFQWLKAPFTVMPIQMFNWISRPDRDFHQNAAAAGVILLIMTLSMNAFAIYLRARLRRRIKW